MVNCVAKGRRIELKAIKELQKEGFTIAFRSIRTMYQMIDFDNAWDICCYSKDCWRLVQVKTGYASNAVRELLKSKRYPFFTKKELWCYRNGAFKKEIIV